MTIYKIPLHASGSFKYFDSSYTLFCGLAMYHASTSEAGGAGPV